MPNTIGDRKYLGFTDDIKQCEGHHIYLSNSTRTGITTLQRAPESVVQLVAYACKRSCYNYQRFVSKVVLYVLQLQNE